MKKNDNGNKYTFGRLCVILLLGEVFSKAVFFMGRTKEEIEAGARVFGGAAHVLGVVGQAVLEADDFKGKEMIAQNIIPSIVLKAFSCELFMKSLVLSGDIKKIHKLDELFNCLSDTDKSAIKEEVVSKMNETIGQYVDSDFFVDLGKVANAFVDWRYFYEDTRTININFLDILFDTLWNH